MSNAEKFVPHYTAEDYQKWEGDWELWDGYAVAMSPSPFGKHSKIASELCRLFGNAIKANPACDSVANIYSELDWIVSQSTVVRPDISISCGDVFEKHITDPPAIVIEILSESTRDHDLKFKRGLYESQAVSYYLTLDPVEKTFTQLNLEGDAYKNVTQGQSVTFTICEDCTFEVSLADVFN